MGRRQRQISQSILRAIFDDNIDDNRSALARILAFFALFQFLLTRHRHETFKKLRKDVWGMDEDEYRESFKAAHKRGELKSVGSLGYSGSTFFTTPDGRFLVKSIPRHSEHGFFTRDLLDPYAAHMAAHPRSLLVRITDLLAAAGPALGRVLATAPSHHVIMENVLHGRPPSPSPSRRASPNASSSALADGSEPDWETYDLKPHTYFYPERDLAGGRLAPAHVHERLADVLPDKLRLSRAARADLLALLEADTALLERHNAVDYSLFLVRCPARDGEGEEKASWREGIRSSDGKWVYRAVVLDFFWAKHKARPRLMTALVSAFDFFARTGHMSITTRPEEYRSRFLAMVESYIENPGV